MNKFNSKDSWIFLSIAAAYRDDPPKLDRVLWSADRINKDIPAPKEIEEAVNHLSAAGLLRMVGYYFILTDLGHSIIKKAGKDGSVFDVRERLEKILEKIEIPDISTPHWHLSESDFEQAYECYRKDFAQVLKELEIKEKK